MGTALFLAYIEYKSFMLERGLEPYSYWAWIATADAYIVRNEWHYGFE